MILMTATGATRFIRHGHACLGVAGPAGLTLTAGGHNNSPLWSRNPTSGAGQLHSWSPWGSGKAADGLPGFNGERCDPVSGSYHLGNGYRAYNPVLRRFNCPDSLSPFGAGGINPYAYCAGDPVNHTDPTGHISWQGILGIVAGAVGALLTGGSALGAIVAAESVAAAWSAASTTTLVVGSMGLLADATGIASAASEDSHPQASSVLGWVSMATGIAGVATGAYLARNLARKGVKALKGKSRYAGINLHPSGASPVQFYKAFGIEREIFRPVYGVVDHEVSGFVSNFRGTGEPGLVMHGSRSGNTDALAFTLGLPTDKNRVLKVLKHTELHDFLNKKNINLDIYSPDIPLNLIACYSGGENGTAQKLANALGRPVRTYTSSTQKVFANTKNLLGNKAGWISSGTKFSSSLKVSDGEIFWPYEISV